MTRRLDGRELAETIGARFPDAVDGADEQDVYIKRDHVAEVCRFLHDDPAMAFDYLAQLTSIDYIDYFEVLYRLVSMKHNHSTVLKTHAFGREDPWAPSVYSIWQGADFQEREVFDLMGVRFEGHPNLKRIMLWEGFEGHPLRKDFLLQRP